jgi:hypothetical protein
MFIVLFLVPALKYPTNPPAVGDASTIYYREILFIGFISISGLSTVILALVYNRKKIFASSTSNLAKKKTFNSINLCSYNDCHVPRVSASPDKITIPIDLIISLYTIKILSLISNISFFKAASN